MEASLLRPGAAVAAVVTSHRACRGRDSEISAKTKLTDQLLDQDKYDKVNLDFMDSGGEKQKALLD